jgi:uracil phosphoribosyltransferase
VAAEATRDLPTPEAEVETPLETTKAHVPGVPRGGRAGPTRRPRHARRVPAAVPKVEVGYFGLERNEVTAVARRYYAKVPKRVEDAVVCLLDPMLTTDGSAAMAIEALKGLGQRRVRLRCVVAAREAVDYLAKREPEAEVYTAALDRPLNDCKYILRGLGDFGDRLVGT